MDVKIHSSDTPPVSGLDEIQVLFDRAVERDEFESDHDGARENPDQGLGNPVSEPLNEETIETIRTNYDTDDYYRGDTDGWIFDHGGTLVTLAVGRPS